MPLPMRFHSDIQEVEGKYFVYFKRKGWKAMNTQEGKQVSLPADTCGYMETSKSALIKRVSLKKLDKFREIPKHWDELTSIRMKI